jgi:hypothetical protein
MKTLLICIAVVVWSSAVSYAQQDTVNFFDTGNDFLRLCETPGDHQVGASCTAYVRGVTDGANAGFQIADAKNSPLFCFDSGVTNGQAEHVVVQFIKTHPDIAHRNTEVLIIKALMAAFKCH